MARLDGVSDAVVRAATRGDGPRIVAIDRVNFDPATTPGPAPAEDADPWRRHAPADVLVAEVDGDVVAYVTLGHPTSLPSNAHVWQVHGLAVHPTFQRRGVARALLRAAVRTVSARGGRRLTLRVLGTNPAAQALYASEGFVVEGVQRGEFVIDGEEVDDVLMARRVP